MASSPAASPTPSSSPPRCADRPEAVLAALMSGAERGLGPMESLRSIHVIEGKPTLSAEAMRALVLAAGHDIEIVESTATKAHRRRPPRRHRHHRRRSPGRSTGPAAPGSPTRTTGRRTPKPCCSPGPPPTVPAPSSPTSSPASPSPKSSPTSSSPNRPRTRRRAPPQRDRRPRTDADPGHRHTASPGHRSTSRHDRDGSRADRPRRHPRRRPALLGHSRTAAEPVTARRPRPSPAASTPKSPKHSPTPTAPPATAGATPSSPSSPAADPTAPPPPPAISLEEQLALSKLVTNITAGQATVADGPDDTIELRAGGGWRYTITLDPVAVTVHRGDQDAGDSEVVEPSPATGEADADLLPRPPRTNPSSSKRN